MSWTRLLRFIHTPSMPKTYAIRVVRGAFKDPSLLDRFGAITLEKLEGDEWLSIDQITVDEDQIKELQKDMVRHFQGSETPWYMDGYEIEDPDEIIVAFGADDGEGGKMFQFVKDDPEALAEIIEYGISKGIPKEQMDFMERAP